MEQQLASILEKLKKLKNLDEIKATVLQQAAVLRDFKSSFDLATPTHTTYSMKSLSHDVDEQPSAAAIPNTTTSGLLPVTTLVHAPEVVAPISTSPSSPTVGMCRAADLDIVGVHVTGMPPRLEDVFKATPAIAVVYYTESLKLIVGNNLQTSTPTRCSSICFEDDKEVLAPVFRPDMTQSIKQQGQVLRPMPWPSFECHSESAYLHAALGSFWYVFCPTGEPCSCWQYEHTHQGRPPDRASSWERMPGQSFPLGRSLLMIFLPWPSSTYLEKSDAVNYGKCTNCASIRADEWVDSGINGTDYGAPAVVLELLKLCVVTWSGSKGLPKHLVRQVINGSILMVQGISTSIVRFHSKGVEVWTCGKKWICKCCHLAPLYCSMVDYSLDVADVSASPTGGNKQQGKLSPLEIKWDHKKIHGKESVLNLAAARVTHGTSDGSTIVISCSEATGIKIWHEKSGKELGTVGTNQLKSNMADISPNGRIAAAVFTADVKVFEIVYSKDSSVKEVNRVMQLKGHMSAVTSLCFTPDPEKIITASKDGTIRVRISTCSMECPRHNSTTSISALTPAATPTPPSATVDIFSELASSWPAPPHIQGNCSRVELRPLPWSSFECSQARTLWHLQKFLDNTCMPKFYPCSIACWEVLLCLAERCDIAYYNCKHLVHQVVGGCPYAIKRMGLFPGDALIFGTEECFLENGIQLKYICQVSCLYGEILEETAASTEDFSINQVSILHVYDWIVHKKKKECMARELYMEVVSADFQGRLLLIKGIWGGSLHLLGSVKKITSVKQDITCNMRTMIQLIQLKGAPGIMQYKVWTEERYRARGQAAFQGGRRVMAPSAFADQVRADNDCYLDGFPDQGYYLEDYYRSPIKLEDVQAPWDPGESALRYPAKLRLGGKPSFKEGGMLGTSPTSTHTWAGPLG